MTTNSNVLALVEEMERRLAAYHDDSAFSVRREHLAALCAAVREARQENARLLQFIKDTTVAVLGP